MKCCSFKTLECGELVVANILMPYLAGVVQYIFESKNTSTQTEDMVTKTALIPVSSLC